MHEIHWFKVMFMGIVKDSDYDTATNYCKTIHVFKGGTMFQT